MAIGFSSFLTSAVKFVRVTRAALQKRVNTSLLNLGLGVQVMLAGRPLFLRGGFDA